MLTALTKNGAKICLANDYKRFTLEYMRNNEEFYCPICGGRVLMKLGEHRVYHFSHLRAACTESNFERESAYHLSGKKALYQWLLSWKIPAYLEQYDPLIRQRPDIVFYFQNKKYALEFQCSKIPEDVFCRRTSNYLNQNYIPLWILGGLHLPQNPSPDIPLSGFTYLFYRKSTREQCYIPYFSPDCLTFSFLQSLNPYSPGRALGHITSISTDGVNPSIILNPPASKASGIFAWQKKIEQVKMNIGCNPGPVYRDFLRELYIAGLNIFLLPPEIGLPVRAAPAISTSPVIWQSYFYIDNIMNKEEGTIINRRDIMHTFEKRIQRGHVVVRGVPLVLNCNPREAVYGYLSVLQSLGIVKKETDSRYRLLKKLIIPVTCAEQSQQEMKFYQEHKKKLML